MSRYHTVEGNAEKINQYVGEIYFFKAKFYYEKVLRFGDVPWLTTDLTTSSEELYNPRNDRGAVIDSICACLDKASEWLPETMQDSRLSKYAALTLKSRVCLFEGTWRKYRNLENADKYLRISIDAAEKLSIVVILLFTLPVILKTTIMHCSTNKIIQTIRKRSFCCLCDR